MDDEVEGIQKFDNFIYNCIASSEVENDWMVADAEASGILNPSGAKPEVDLRTSWWEINHQGATGSCVGWAVADSLLRWHFVKSGQIKNNQKLSVRYIWVAAKEFDEHVVRPTTFIEKEGTSLKAALDIARHYGVVTENILPFESDKSFEGETNEFYMLAAKLRIAGYVNLGVDLDRWKIWISNNGPIVVRLNVDSSWINNAINASSTQGKLDKYDSQSVKINRGGHAAAIVGYKKDYFIVRNSWGTDWGDDGFAYASDQYARAAFTEAYGVF